MINYMHYRYIKCPESLISFYHLCLKYILCITCNEKTQATSLLLLFYLPCTRILLKISECTIILVCLYIYHNLVKKLDKVKFQIHSYTTAFCNLPLFYRAALSVSVLFCWLSIDFLISHTLAVFSSSASACFTCSLQDENTMLCFGFCPFLK